jgi:toxin ParE1/3/4
MRLPVDPAAAAELGAAVAWHEGERPGQGSLLMDEVARRVEQAARFPRSGAPVLGLDARYDVRMFIVRRFPYVVITALVNEQRVVIAVAHTSRTPGYWRDRLP